jgi:putative endonuclease
LLKNSNYRTGIEAEERAAEMLRAQGYSIVESRLSARRGTDSGEIDLVAVRGRIIVFAEVKKRASIDLALESIMTWQQARVERAAEVFLTKHPEYDGYDCRFDAIVFDGDGNSRNLENAWGM